MKELDALEKKVIDLKSIGQALFGKYQLFGLGSQK